MTNPPELKRAARSARDLATARQRLAAATAAAADTAIDLYQRYGYPETEIAQQLGVNRLTVRRWLGKN